MVQWSLRHGACGVSVGVEEARENENANQKSIDRQTEKKEENEKYRVKVSDSAVAH